MDKSNLHISKSKVWEIFDDISRTYDLTNHVLSFGQDIMWRKSLSHYLGNAENQTVLDVATGTADVLISLIKTGGKIKKAYGIDLSERMMEIGRKKVKSAGYEALIELKTGDANNIPFDDNTMDAATISFGIRNVEDPLKALKEMARVIKPGGKIIILEFSLPEAPILKALQLLYLRYVVPLVGGILSGDRASYSYLNKTVEGFPYGEAFLSLMKAAGFYPVERNHVTFGVATIYRGIK